MKTLRITSLAAVTIGIISIILSAQLKGDGGLASSHSFGYTTFGLGLITFLISLFETRKKKALALLISGMTLVVFGEKIPALLIFSITRKDGASRFLDLTPTFFVLGVVCVAFSWIILVIDSKE
jgi:hypothetical protein